jgi:hypothetical protein
MDGLDQGGAYDELFEPLALALGHLAFAAMALEKAMLADLIQRRVIRDGPEEVFGQGLVTRLERKSAGLLLLELRLLGYEEPLAKRIASVIQERNHFIHHLYDDPNFIRALGERKGVEMIVLRVEEVVDRLYQVVKELEPGVTAGMQQMFGRTSDELFVLIKEIDPDDLKDEELRQQLEALQGFPDDTVSESE